MTMMMMMIIIIIREIKLNRQYKLAVLYQPKFERTWISAQSQCSHNVSL
jgi:hypothetical protein